MGKQLRNLVAWSVFLVVSLLLFGAPAPAAAATTIPAGEVAGTWTAAGSPYLIDGDITVPAGQTLTVEAGVEVLFQSWYKLTVNGVLQVEGTESAPVLFTSATAETPNWLGIRFVDGEAGSRVTHAIIEQGQATGASPENMGGGLYIENTAPTIANSTIRNNFATRAGGAIALVNASPVLRDNVIAGNQAGQGGTSYGGALYIDGGAPLLEGNLIENNHIYVQGSYSTPRGYGGAIYAYRADLRLERNVIANNQVDAHSNSYGRGGGLYLSAGTSELVNNTITGNSVAPASDYYPREGGGLYLYYPNLVIANTILWNDTPEEIFLAGGGELAVGYSTIANGQAGIVNSETTTLTNLGGNNIQDPLFSDAANGDYTLQSSSPAVDAGTAYLEHNGRVIVDLAPEEYAGDAPEIGALELGSEGANELPVAVAAADYTSGSAPLTVQFDGSGSSDPDGSIVAYEWDFDDGHSASGPTPTHTYETVGSFEATLTVTDDEGAAHSDTISITVLDGTTIRGGEVAGTWTAAGSPYRIDGDISVPAGQTLTVEGGVTVLFQSWYKLTVNGVLQVDGTESAPVLFTSATAETPNWLGIRFVDGEAGSRVTHAIIEQGQATGASPENMGGGLYIENTAPTIANSTIRNNFATRAGGGIALVNASPVLRDNVIAGNQAGQGGTSYGGALYIDGGAPLLEGNLIENNHVYVQGSYSTPRGYGGGIYAYRADLRLERNVIANNQVDAHSNSYGRGGGLYLSAGTSELVNNTITGNSVAPASTYYPREGGGLYLYYPDLVIANTILWNDTPEEIFLAGGGELAVAYSDVQGGQAGIANPDGATVDWLAGNLDADPRFVDPAGGDYQSQEGSPAVDAGTASFAYNGRTIVALADADYQGNAPDMGALESPYSAGSGNEAPVAVAAATPTGGSAPLTVQFDGSGSYDPDGTIVAYAWNFGDGNSGSGATPAHTYEAAGSYVAELTVTDDAGATRRDRVSVTVEAATQALHVEALSATGVKERKWERGEVTVLITDGAGRPVAGALVTVAYSGPTSGEVSGTTGADGTVALLTDTAKRSKDSWCFEVTDVTADGWTYDVAANVVTAVCTK